jgi:hypothetical protein
MLAPDSIDRITQLALSASVNYDLRPSPEHRPLWHRRLL